MLYDTILVILLAISTIIILHIVLSKMILPRNQTVESFIRDLSSAPCRLPRPVIIPTKTTRRACQEPRRTTENIAVVHPPLSESTIPTTKEDNAQSLESELKQWMQQEAMNWSSSAMSVADTTNDQENKSTSSATHKMSTSIDKLFADQQVQLGDVKMPPSFADTATETNTKNTKQAQNNATVSEYTNTMNVGDLGGGLHAFDSLESSFATLE